MHVEEFLELVRADAPITQTTMVTANTQEILARIQARTGPDGILLTGLMAEPGKIQEPRELTYAHLLGAPASLETIDAWKQDHPSVRLPDDLVALIQTMNGIHLWADVARGRSYLGMAPLEEWTFARNLTHGLIDDEDDRCLVLTYHSDGAHWIALDSVDQTYVDLDHEDPSSRKVLATNVEGLLDCLWKQRIHPQ
jgi:hypothetical protein